MDESFFVREISETQSKYKLIKKNGNQQSSYNLSVDLEKKLLDCGLIRKIQYKNDDNIYYSLAEGTNLILGNGILSLIGIQYKDIRKNVILVHTTTNNKFQIRRNDHNVDDMSLNWFKELYDKNCEGANFIIKYNQFKKEIIIDNIFITSKIISKIESDENNADLNEEFPKYSKEEFLSDVFMTSDEYETIKGLILNKSNIILKGSPGVGKTYMAKRFAYSIMGEKNKNNILSIQFHQSFSYEDFIEGIRPDEQGNFFVKDGLFKEFVERAKEDRNHCYFCIIDEINRGNLSKIFGELMKLIEKDKREEESVLLPYSKKEFSIPKNIFIIGTMNTADRSLSLVDYALRRRFAFYSVLPAFNKQSFKDYLINENKISQYNVQDICDKFNTINAKINNDLGKGFEIGHSYFVDSINPEKFDISYKNIVEYEIIPLLEEYWFDDEEKVEEYKELL